MPDNWKINRKILLCITGGIAAYKIPYLVRLITKANCEVEVILTKSAEEFVTRHTLATLTGRKIWGDEKFFTHSHEIPHIKLAQWADVIAIAPASANTIAKISHGICDNLLTSTILAATCPVVIFPAMNENMYENKSTQENLKVLSQRGLNIIQPSEGRLACGITGKGRMPEPNEILHEIFRVLCPVKDMFGKNVVVTAGSTHEYLDPVRYLANPSTGKMGVAMARSAWYRGANVKLIAGPVDLDAYGFEVVDIISALDMLREVMANLEWADYIVKAAAVGDYRAKDFHEHKIKREGKDTFSLLLVQNPDIAYEVGKVKRDGQVLIGFAAETDNVYDNAREKLARKNLDYILANDVMAENSGFASDYNTLRLISRDTDKPEKFFTGLKEDIAYEVWDYVMSD